MTAHGACPSRWTGATVHKTAERLQLLIGADHHFQPIDVVRSQLAPERHGVTVSPGMVAWILRRARIGNPRADQDHQLALSRQIVGSHVLNSQFNAVRNMSITLRERQMREGEINCRLRKTAEESRRDFHLRSRGKLDGPYPGRARRKMMFEGVLDKILFTGPVRRGDPG